MVSTINHARKRVATVLEEIDRLKQSEFPYKHSSDALDLLAEIFKEHQRKLERISQDISPDTTDTACSNSLRELINYVPILGFILRSTNVRNAFEVYAPLLRLARSIIRDDTKLIVSSEWVFYPVVYLAKGVLNGFVLVGLPAPESANPLLIPLAGHELGHSVWETNKFETSFKDKIVDGVLKELKENRWGEYTLLYPQYKKDELTNNDLFTTGTWQPAYTWALLQAEEIFCDFFGLRLFAESYLHAFAYLLSPGVPGEHSIRYPMLKRRVSHLVDAARRMEVIVPPGFDEAGYVTETYPDEPSTRLLVSIADAVSASLTLDMENLVKDYANQKTVPMRDTDKVAQICYDFRKKISPTSNQRSLTDLLNASWICSLDPDLWKDVPQIKPEEKDRVLKDLMLKSMEVSEVYELLKISL